MTMFFEACIRFDPLNEVIPFERLARGSVLVVAGAHCLRARQTREGCKFPAVAMTNAATGRHTLRVTSPRVARPRGKSFSRAVWRPDPMCSARSDARETRA